MCQLKLALAGEAPVQEATELLVKAVQKGTLVASIDAEPIQVAVSGEGFQFDTSKGTTKTKAIWQSSLSGSQSSSMKKKPKRFWNFPVTVSAREQL